MNWLLTGLAAGATIGVGAIAIVGTGGLAAAAVVGGLAAGGAGIGELFSTMSWAPKEICGVIKGSCSGNVFTNGIPAARTHVDIVDCAKHSPPYPPIATGSATVFINGQPAARVNDKTGCSAVITSGSNNVYIGGGTMQTDVLQPEKLVPDAVHAGLLVVGIGSARVLGGPIIATAGLVGGTVGQIGGELLGGKGFGIGSDGQKWAMLGGALLGGVLGAKGGGRFVRNSDPQALSSSQGAIRGNLYEANSGTSIGSAAQPRMTWRDNVNGVRRTPQEAIALAKQQGVVIPEDVAIYFVENDRLLNTVGAKAEYSQLPRNAANQGPNDLITWDSLKNSQGKIPVRFSTDLLSSDEATVAHIGHEMYELNKFEDIGLMKLADFRKAIMDSKSGGATNNWHEQAWDYADSLVTKMRGVK